MQKSILVTGGAGFIGSNLVRYLLRQHPEYRIINVDKLTYAGNLDSLADLLPHPRHIFEQADICDPQAVHSLLQEHQPEAILHLAAESHVDRSIAGPGQFIQTNVLGTYHLLEAARQYWSGLDEQYRDRFRFLQVSTDEVYGSLGPEGLFHEASPYQPSSPYAASKASSDHLVRAWYHTYGLPVLITNCSNNYGPYQFPEKLIPLMTLSAVEGRSLPIYGKGENIRDWLYVEDHARALHTVLLKGRPGRTYNIGGNCEKTNLEVVQTICDMLNHIKAPATAHGALTADYRELISFVPDRPGHDLRYAIDNTRIREELGWKPQESFQTGLRKTINWYLENQAWVDRARSGAYQDWLQQNYELQGRGRI